MSTSAIDAIPVNALPSRRERIWALVLLLVVLALLYLLIVHPFFVQPLLATEARVQALAERSQRVRAELQEAPRVASQLQRARTQLAARSGFLPEASAELAVAGLVQRLETVVSQASPGHRSCAISNRSTLPADMQGRFARVAVQVRLRCGTLELSTVLHSLESGAPGLFIDNLNVLAQRVPSSPGDSGNGLDVTFDLSGYVRPGAVTTEAGDAR
ncbi:MAG TPA: type II secretion system protein GspM [Stenotrophomonas sp.]|nr:type II secretion system protein GspM [Stenotrophomonas sp.]